MCFAAIVPEPGLAVDSDHCQGIGDDGDEADAHAGDDDDDGDYDGDDDVVLD